MIQRGDNINSKRRESLKIATRLLEEAYSRVSSAREDEEDARDNMPENLQGSDRFEKMEETVSYLSDSEELINEAIDKIQNCL